MLQIALVCMRVLGVLLALMCVYVVALFALIRGGEQLVVSESNNVFFDLAGDISTGVPDVYLALARYDQSRASLVENIKHREKWLESSLMYWSKAHQARPNWPYYLLGALGVELMLGKKDEDIRRLFSQITVLARNERSIDRSLLEMAMIAWRQLTDKQRYWVIDRLETAMPNTVKSTLVVAAERRVKGSVCSRLPWQTAKRYCLH